MNGKYDKLDPKAPLTALNGFTTIHVVPSGSIVTGI